MWSQPPPLLSRMPIISCWNDIETGLHPHAVLFTLHRNRRKFGPGPDNGRAWGSRTLGLDLVAYDDFSIDKAEPTPPHPRLFERAFVLVPLAEIAPDRVIAGRRVRDALAKVDTSGIEKLRPR